MKSQIPPFHPSSLPQAIDLPPADDVAGRGGLRLRPGGNHEPRDRPRRRLRVGKPAHRRARVVQVYCDYVVCLPHRGLTEVGVRRIPAPPGSAICSDPGIARGTRPAHEAEGRRRLPAHHERDRSLLSRAPAGRDPCTHREAAWGIRDATESSGRRGGVRPQPASSPPFSSPGPAFLLTAAEHGNHRQAGPASGTGRPEWADGTSSTQTPRRQEFTARP